MGYQWQEGTTGIILNFSSNKMRADSEECVYLLKTRMIKFSTIFISLSHKDKIRKRSFMI